MNPCIAMDYIESCLKIKTKSGTVVPFRLNDAQRKLYAVAKRQQDAGKPVRLIILKARQLGFSTLTEGLIFHACATRKNVNALIVAHREDATANLFRMSKLFYDELPAPVKPMLRAERAGAGIREPVEAPQRAGGKAGVALTDPLRHGGRARHRTKRHAAMRASFGVRLLAGRRGRESLHACRHFTGRAESAGHDGRHREHGERL